MKNHRVSPDDFTELAAARGGLSAMRLLKAGQLSRRIVALRMIFEAAAARLTDAELRRLLDRSVSVLVTAARRRRAAVDAVLLDPMVGAWTAICLSRLHFPAGQEPGRTGSDRPQLGEAGDVGDIGYLGAIAATAALRAGITADFELPVAADALHLPGFGRVDFAASAAGHDSGSRWYRLRTRDGRADIRGPDGATTITVSLDEPCPPGATNLGPARWLPSRRLGGELDGKVLDLRVEDHDPHRALGSEGMHPGLDHAEFARWRAMFAQAWELLVRGHHDQAAAIEAGLTCVVPLAGESHLAPRSATAEASFGAVRLTLPADATTLASVLVHEFQHTKLYALTNLLPLVTAGCSELHHVPWREDPRPLDAVLQGAYAHLALIDFWYRSGHLDPAQPAPAQPVTPSLGRDPTFEFAWTRAAVGRALATVAGSSELTPTGERFTAVMRREVDRWADVPVHRSVLTAVHDNLAAPRPNRHLA